ncbi:MAG: DNA-processing protein DprA [Bacteroidota bacterium]
MSDLLYKVALSRIDGVGIVTSQHLLAKFGDAREVFHAHARELVTVPGISDAMARRIPQGHALLLAEEELRYLERYNIQAFFFTDDDYPERLRRISDAPTLFYYRGNAPLNSRRTVGIIGTRKPSPNGLIQVNRLVEELGAYQPLILSGLAYGIDIAAHKAALRHGLPTVGVLGHGLRHLYPAKHRKTAQEMIENGGLLTEYPFTTGPDSRHFPMRNRIVAALSDAMIVVETPRKGGSIITAEYANTYHKDVFAVPGRLNDRTSEGCNWLIKTHKAALLESAEDIGYVLRWSPEARPPAEQLELFEQLSSDEKLVVDLLRQQEQTLIDDLSIASGLSSGVLATVLLEIELKGLIRTLPGKRYMLIR